MAPPAGTKKEKRFQKIKDEFDKGELTREKLLTLSGGRQLEYLRKEIAKKYETNDIDFSCTHCGITVLYTDSGYITDDELLADPKVAAHHEHM